MSNHLGLAYCGSDFGNSFCICKLIQVITSSVILIIVVHDMVVRYKIERQINFFILICIFMLLCLVRTPNNKEVNIIYSFDHQIYYLSDFEGCLLDDYFGIIVYYVARRLYSYSKPLKHKTLIKWIINITFIGYLALLFGILIKNLVVYVYCDQTLYIIADALALIASIILVVMGVIHTKRQQKKIKGLKNPQHYKNPLFDIWIWIAVNIFAQICSFVESLVFALKPEGQCSFSQNQNVDSAIKFIFAVLSFHLGMIATVIFFRKKYNLSSRNGKISTPERLRKQSANIQLIGQFDSSLKQTTRSNQ